MGHYNGHSQYIPMTPAEAEWDRRSRELARATYHCRQCAYAPFCDDRGTEDAIGCTVAFRASSVEDEDRREDTYNRFANVGGIV